METLAPPLPARVRHGIGLRAAHYGEVMAHGLPVGFVEVITENVLGRGGLARAVVERVRRDSPIVLHGVSLGIGDTDPLPRAHLASLASLARELEPAWISEHLCWSGFGGHHGHDLWPLPHDEETLAHVVGRVTAVQELLGRRILLENVSSYLTFQESTMTEQTFLAEVARRADCLILLDVNNVVVSAHNHGFSPTAYLDALPAERIAQLHLAGHADKGTFLLDDHGCPPQPAVWQLYRQVLERFGPKPAIVEWDDNLPALTEVIAVAEEAQRFEAAAIAGLDESGEEKR